MSSFRRAVPVLSVALALLVTPTVLTGCFDSGQTDVADEAVSSLPRRRGTLIVEACALDSTQRATVQSAGARRLLQDVVLLCLTVDEQGAISPGDEDRRATLLGEVKSLQELGYRVALGVGLGTSRDALYSAERGAVTIGSPTTRATALATLTTLTKNADAVDLIVAPLPSASREDVEAYVGEASQAFGKERTELFVPPSISSPSDVPGGDAFSLPTLAPLVSRFRVMTLDFSCCPGPGPTTDPTWIADVMAFTRTQAAGTALDFSFPLFGTDFGPNGQRSVTYIEATGLAAANRVPVQRSPTGAPMFRYPGPDGTHDVYFDDVVSTSLTLSASDAATVDAATGVIFYGLGAEQPGLFDDLSRRTP